MITLKLPVSFSKVVKIKALKTSVSLAEYSENDFVYLPVTRPHLVHQTLVLRNFVKRKTNITAAIRVE